MRPPRPLDWAAAGAAGSAEDWQMCNASAEAAVTAAGEAAEDGPEAAAEAEAYREGPPAKPGDYNQDPTKILVQTGRQVALNVVPAIVRATKTTWNIKQRLERQQEQELRREQQRDSTTFFYIGREVGLVDSASEKNKARAVVERSIFY